MTTNYTATNEILWGSGNKGKINAISRGRDYQKYLLRINITNDVLIPSKNAKRYFHSSITKSNECVSTMDHEMTDHIKNNEIFCLLTAVKLSFVNNDFLHTIVLNTSSMKII